MYAAVDMKSFYASVECVERGLDPLNTNLVVADISRTSKTICLAVSPSLKAIGLTGRPRMFEVEQKVQTVNYQRKRQNRYRSFVQRSSDATELKQHPEYELDFITAPPRMKLYEEYSTKIYSILLRYFSSEDIHVYSCDESFIHIGPYLHLYHKTANELLMTVVKEILSETGITATAGIGTNMYLAKIAMDIMAKKMPADKNGVRIAELDELSYRKNLWEHTPLTDFWGYGKGISEHLERLGIHNMGEICLLSERNDELLYREFGTNAEIIIDHAWGYENCTIQDIQSYTPKNRSISSGQVLSRAYENSEAEIILKEMTDALVLKMISCGCATNHISLDIQYDSKDVYETYNGKWSSDRYERKVPVPLSCSKKIEYTASFSEIMRQMLELFHSRVDKRLFIKKISIGFGGLIGKDEIPEKVIQYGLFDDVEALEKKRRQKELQVQKEESIQKAVLDIKEKYGKNALLRGISYQKEATARERNGQIGGHRA